MTVNNTRYLVWGISIFKRLVNFILYHIDLMPTYIKFSNYSIPLAIIILFCSMEVLQEKINCHTGALFPVKGDRFFLNDRLFFELKKLNHKVKNAKQIRASVITHWLSQYNIREVQYMAGHRYISSTERYLQDDLESLHDYIESLHPIG